MTETDRDHGGNDAVRARTEAGALTITLNRPAAGNALRPADRDEVIRLLAVADGDPHIRVVVIRAEGRHFCTGADVTTMGGDTKRVTGPMRRIMNGAQALMSSVLDCGKPVIAVVQGPAAGIGAHLAYASDLVIATDNAYFVESFVKRGLVVDGGGAYLLPRRLGMQRAKELVMFGEKLGATEAAALGLVNRVVPAGLLDETVADFVQRLASAPTSSITLTKRLMNESPDTDRASSFLAEAMAQELQSYAQDSTEGVRSFVEKRPADFVGW